jgi:uncharacterized protein YjbI with pentapeptide repeats
MEVSEKVKDLSKGNYFAKDFSGIDLRGVPMHHSRFNLCKFVGSDMSGNDCSHSDFSGSDLTNVRCNGTDFGHSTLGCRFYPKDAFGITLTMECRTFKGMMVSKLWWLSFVFFATLMIPEKDKGADLNDLLIKALGGERYIKLKQLFEARQI